MLLLFFVDVRGGRNISLTFVLAQPECRVVCYVVCLPAVSACGGGGERGGGRGSVGTDV